MNCPFCQTEMLKGYLNLGNAIWSERKHKLSTLSGANERYAFRLGVPLLSLHHVDSYMCPEGKKMIVDTSEYENDL